MMIMDTCPTCEATLDTDTAARLTKIESDLAWVRKTMEQIAEALEGIGKNPMLSAMLGKFKIG